MWVQGAATYSFPKPMATSANFCCLARAALFKANTCQKINLEQVRKARSAVSAAFFSNFTTFLEEFLSLPQIDGFGETDSMNQNYCTAPASCMKQVTADPQTAITLMCQCLQNKWPCHRTWRTDFHGFPVDSAQASLEGGPRVSGAEDGRERR